MVVIVLGSFKLAMTLLDGGSAPRPPAVENSSASPLPAQAPADDHAKPGCAGAGGAFDDLADTDRPAIAQSHPRRPLPKAARRSRSRRRPAAPAAPAPGQRRYRRRSRRRRRLPVGKPPSVQIPPTEKLPDAIGGPVLRTAALKGDPSAAYEIGVRFAEGKGVAVELDEAAKWYDRAAQAGVVPAIFRLGTLYEKGLGVKKDIDIARRYYMQAAERGNAKAMHNLAVLDADGGGKGANYKSAAQWFRKAADRGVADSQFNLGILYARGIGVEQNLAESYKWFSLAAAQGDVDSARKRDDIAKRLDAAVAGRGQARDPDLHAPSRSPTMPSSAPAPAGGWDSAAAGQHGKARRAKPRLRSSAPPR